VSAAVSRERVIERIRGCLNIAQDTNFANEAETAMLKAQRLLVTYGLTMQDVAGERGAGLGGPGSEEVADAAVGEPSGRLPWWHRLLAGIIADNFRCAAYLRRSRSGAPGARQGPAGFRSTVCLIGRPADVEVAGEVYRFGVKAVAQSARRFTEQLPDGVDGRRLRNDFVYGFLQGLKDKFAEQVERHRWALVLTKDAQVEERVRGMRLRRAAPARPGFGGDQEARQEGYRSGQEFGESARPGKPWR
jgi:hypothetical protein